MLVVHARGLHHRIPTSCSRAVIAPQKRAWRAWRWIVTASSWRSPWKTGADAAHLVGASRVDRLRGFLLGVDAEGTEEIRDAHHAAAGLLEACEQIPVEGELETWVDAAGTIPGAFAPEELRFCHNKL